MGEAVDKGQDNAASLLAIEQFEAALQGFHLRRGTDPFDDVRLECFVTERGIVRGDLAGELADGVERPEADDAGEPRGAGTRSPEKAAAFCQIWTKASCNTSAAISGCRTIRSAIPYSLLDSSS